LIFAAADRFGTYADRQATLKLTPTASALRCMALSRYRSARAVSRPMAQPVTPCAGFMDGLRAAREVGGVDLPEAGALLMIEADGEPLCSRGALDALAPRRMATAAWPSRPRRRKRQESLGRRARRFALVAHRAGQDQ
jgi:hypothetical protein